MGREIWGKLGGGKGENVRNNEEWRERGERRCLRIPFQKEPLQQGIHHSPQSFSCKKVCKPNIGLALTCFTWILFALESWNCNWFSLDLVPILQNCLLNYFLCAPR